MTKNTFIQFDYSELEDLANAFATTTFSLKGTEKQVEDIIAESNLEQFTSEGKFGERFGFDPWEQLAESTIEAKARLNLGNKQILERTGALGDRLVSPKVTTDGFNLNITFSGTHAFLIPIFQGTRPLVIVTEPEFEKLGIVALDNFVKDFSSRLKVKKTRGK